MSRPKPEIDTNTKRIFGALVGGFVVLVACAVLGAPFLASLVLSCLGGWCSSEIARGENS